MIEAKVARSSYAAGEVSPFLYARDDLARQQIGAKRIENLYVRVEGGLERIPGTRYIANFKTMSEKGLALPFRFNAANSYDLLLNGGAMRVKKDGGIVETSPGVPYELAIPYAAADLENVRYAQDKDVLFLACRGKRPRELTRADHDDWSLANHAPLGGPVKDMNTDTGKTIQASAVTGSITLTANNDRFESGHIGGVWRLDEPNLLAVPLWAANEDIVSLADKISTSGATAIGNMTDGGFGLGAAFDGNTNADAANGVGKSGAREAYIGADFGSGAPKAVNRVVVFGSNNQGYVNALNPKITIELWAKASGSAPANATDGVKLGETSFDDTANEAANGRIVYSTDATTLYRHWWVRIINHGAAAVMYAAEVEFYAWRTPRVPARRRYNGRVYEAVTDGNAGATPPTHDEGDLGSGAQNVVWRYLHSGYGYARIDGVTNATSATATVLSRLPDSVVDTPTSRWWASAWDDIEGWPERVVLFQRRMWWFRSDRFWASAPFDFWDHEPAYDTATGLQKDDSPLSGRILSPDGSLVSVEWALASGQLVLGMQDGEWVIRPGTNATAAVTATNINPLNDTDDGSAAQIPAQIAGGVLFIGKSRKRLHMARFDRLSDVISTEELTLSARHILRGLARRVVYQRDPHKIAWIQCNDGSLICFTYMPKEKVAGFTRRPFVNGIVEDICVTPQADGTADVLTLAIRREIDGNTVRYWEEMAAFFEPLDEEAPTAEGAWFLDCALRYQGTAATVISGLDHLEGQEVGVFANGAMRPRATVSGGQITLDRAATDVVVGIPQAWKLVPLSVDPEKREGSSKGDYKQISSAILELVLAASGIAKGNPDAEPERIVIPSAKLPAGAPLPLLTGRVEVGCEAVSDFETFLELSGDDALPFGISGIVPNVQIASK